MKATSTTTVGWLVSLAIIVIFYSALDRSLDTAHEYLETCFGGSIGQSISSHTLSDALRCAKLRFASVYWCSSMYTK